jgi:hypothetical protein
MASSPYFAWFLGTGQWEEGWTCLTARRMVIYRVDRFEVRSQLSQEFGFAANGNPNSTNEYPFLTNGNPNSIDEYPFPIVGFSFLGNRNALPINESD